MRKEIHPEYREVLFHDTSVDEYFIINSTLNTSQTKEHDGKTYPYYQVEISSSSQSNISIPYLHNQFLSKPCSGGLLDPKLGSLDNSS